MAFWILLLVALFNVSLGFSAAVYLRRRYQRRIVEVLDVSLPVTMVTQSRDGNLMAAALEEAIASSPPTGFRAPVERPSPAPVDMPSAGPAGRASAERAERPSGDLDATASVRRPETPSEEPTTTAPVERPGTPAGEPAATPAGEPAEAPPAKPSTTASAVRPETPSGESAETPRPTPTAAREPGGPTESPLPSQEAKRLPATPEVVEPVVRVPAAAAVRPGESKVAEAAPSASEQSVEDLLRQVEDYENRLDSLDKQLRGGEPSADPEVLVSYAATLHEANREYLELQRPVLDQFQEVHKEQATLKAVRDGVRAAIESQTEHIRYAEEVLEALDTENHPEESYKQALVQATRLRGASDHLRDTLGEATVEVARAEQRLESPGKRPKEDPLTGILNRAGLEAELESFRYRDPHRARQLSVALVDLDQFARVNERYGRDVGNRILRGIARLVQAEARGEYRVARFTGQRFVILMPDAEIRLATAIAERVRQTVETGHFRHQEFDIRVTVSCGVTAAGPQDTSEGLFGRAEATLQEAKRYGRNRTFFHEGRYPNPVVPPNLTLQERVVTL